MRLRTEAGDYSIVIKNGAVAPIRKDLNAYQLVGVIVEQDGKFYVVTAVEPAVGGATYTLTAGEITLTYTKATGAIAVA